MELPGWILAFGRVPLFFFHLINDVDVPDDEGKEFPDLDTAIQHARIQALFTAAETLKAEGRLALNHRIEIEDATGKVIGTVTFGDVVSIEA